MTAATTGRPARPRRTARPDRWRTVGRVTMTFLRGVTRGQWMLFGSFLLWWQLHRYWFPMADDYQFTMVHDQGGIGYGPLEWLDLARYDWLGRNGRLADSVVRLVFRPGFWTFHVLSPVALTALGALLGRWFVRDERDEGWCRLLGLLCLPTVLLLWREQTGDAIFWASASINYVWPTLGVALVGSTLVQVLRGHDLPGGRWRLAASMAIVSQLMHEQASWTLAAMAGVTALVLRRRLMGAGRRLVVACGVGFLLQMSAPGLWRRLGTVGDESAVSSGLMRTMVLSAHTMVGHTMVLWTALVVVLALARSRAPGRPARRICGAAASACTLLLLAAAAWASRVPENDALTHPLPEGMWGWQLLFFLALASALGTVTAACLALRSWWGPVPLLAWVAVVASWTPLLLTGIESPRAYVVPMLWLVVTVLSTSLTLSAGTRWHRSLLVGLVAVMAVLSCCWYFPAHVGLRRNQHFVNDRVVPQFRASVAGKRPVILLPRPLPDPAYTYANAFLVPRYAIVLQRGWFLDPSVKFNQRSWQVVDTDPGVLRSAAYR